MNWQKTKGAFKRAFNHTFQFNPFVCFLFWVSTTWNILARGNEVFQAMTIVLTVIMVLIFCRLFYSLLQDVVL